MKTLIISPTYNEKENIATVIQEVFKRDLNYHMLIVDDSSPDGTASIVEKLQESYPNLHLQIRNKKNGLGKAYIFGFKWALSKDYDAIVQMDADMSHHPKEIKKMTQLLKKYDLSIGSRYIDGISVVNWPIRRLILSYGANVYSRIVTGMPIKDATGGFKVWRKDVFRIN